MLSREAKRKAMGAALKDLTLALARANAERARKRKKKPADQPPEVEPAEGEVEAGEGGE